MTPFVHLHLHSEYSLLDGACRLTELPRRIKELGMDAVALTDHGVMCGLVDFYKACGSEGVKPILGFECYVAPESRFGRVHGVDNRPYHLVLLAENQVGYENLMVLSSAGFTEGFYSKPRVDKELLRRHSEGLIALSACLAGEIPRRLSASDYEGAKQVALEYASIFGKGNFYIELQNHNIAAQKEIIPDLLRLCRETDLPPVITNDAHYLRKEDAAAQEVLVCIQTGKTLNEEGRLEFETDEFYVKSGDEMKKAFAAFADPLIDEGLANTCRIAERCHTSYTFGQLKLPAFIPPAGRECDELFEDLCAKGLAEKYADRVDDSLLARLAYEKKIIRSMGFRDFYLIVWDFIRFAKESGIPVGPGRGSGAGSLVAYLLGITDVDPIRYGLLFERFLNPERVTMPDFDIDFDYEGRQQVIDYVTEKYGSDRVSQIITFGTLAARGAVRDVGRVMGLPYALPDRIAKMIPHEPGVTLSKALAINSELKREYENDLTVKKLVDTALTLEGVPRNASTHAAGVVITPERVNKYLPLQKNDEAVVTQFEKETVEKLGLLKIDFLGLRTLTVIRKTLEAIRKQNPDFVCDFGHQKDEKVYAMLGRGDSQGVFQLESGGMRQLLSQLKPKSIEDLIAAISLYRPGPMKNIPVFLANRANPQKLSYAHPALEPILSVTCGVIVYQEQVMQICRELAGYSYGRSDLVRRAMAKKQQDIMEAERQAFVYGQAEGEGKAAVKGCVANGIPEKVALQIFEEMTGFAAYAFNKSHAAGYAVLAYETAYLKYHYPKEFFAAMMSVYLESTDKVGECIAFCRQEGIRILPASVNKSDVGFEAQEDGIRFGLLAIRNLGKAQLEALVADREENGPFADFPSFCRRAAGLDMGVRSVEALIRAGALDNLGWNRCQMMARVESLVGDCLADRRREVSGQMSFLSEEDDPAIPPYLAEYSDDELLAMEQEATGFYQTGHPLHAYADLAEKAAVRSMLSCKEGKDKEPATLLFLVRSLQEKKARDGRKMAILQGEDMDGRMEILVFPDLYARAENILQTGSIYFAKGRLSVREEEATKLLAENFLPPTEESAKKLTAEQKSSYQKPSYPKKSVGEGTTSVPKTAEEKPAEKEDIRLVVKLSSAKDFERLAPYLQKRKGSCAVLLYLADEGVYRQTPPQFFVDGQEETADGVRSLGFEAVLQKKKR